jgi:hypothetical protein
VVVALTPDDLQALLVPPGLSTRPLSLDEVERLELPDEDDQPPARPLPLETALLVGDELRLTPIPPASHDGRDVRLATPLGLLALVGGVASAASPLASYGALVWLADALGEPLSAPIPVTNPMALAQKAAAGRREPGHSIPELQDSDLEESELGRLLAWLDAHYIFDIDATTIPEHVGRSLEMRDEEPAGVEQAAVEWDLLREAALLDPRAARYVHVGRRFADSLAEVAFDPELAELAVLVARVPGLSAFVPAPRPGPDVVGEAAGRVSRPWSFERRREVRFSNAIERFARAHADPRNAAVHPEAPAVNFTCLVELIWALWVLDHEGRPEIGLQRRILLFSTLLLAFDEYLRRLEPSERQAAAAAIAAPARSLAAALVYLALRDGARWEDVLFDWQQAIRRLAFELDVLAADDPAARALADIGVSASAADIADRLQWAALFDDESYWASRLAARLGLRQLLVRPMPRRPAVPLDLMVIGLTGAMADHRFVRLIAETAARGPGGFTVSDGERTLARVLLTGDDVDVAIRLHPDDRRLTPLGSVTREQLQAAAEEGTALGDVLSVSNAIAPGEAEAGQ